MFVNSMKPIAQEKTRKKGMGPYGPHTLFSGLSVKASA